MGTSGYKAQEKGQDVFMVLSTCTTFVDVMVEVIVDKPDVVVTLVAGIK